MVNLKKMSVEDVKKNTFLINQINDLYGMCDENSFFEYDYKDNKRWLYKWGEHYTIIGIEGEYIVYTTFIMGDNHKICHMDFDTFYASRTLKGEMLVWKENSSLADSLVMYYGGNDFLETYFDGVVVHHQFNSETGEDMYVCYRTMYKDPAFFYESMFARPFHITFVKDGKCKSYIWFTTELGDISYDVITLKEHGLFDLVNNGSYSLNNFDKKIIRYFRVLYETDNGNCLLLHPISKPHTLEDMDEMIKSKGFTRNINQDVLNYFNNTLSDKDEMLALEEALKPYLKEQEKEEAIRYLRAR